MESLRDRLRTKFSTQVRRAYEISYAAYEISYRGGLNFVRTKFRTYEISYDPSIAIQMKKNKEKIILENWSRNHVKPRQVGACGSGGAVAYGSARGPTTFVANTQNP